MKRLWAPWRNKFVFHPIPKACIFCEKPKSKKDRKNLILERGKTVYALLNLYPYNNGHLMIAPYRHLNDISLLTDKESTELFDMTKRCVKKLKGLLKPEGFNIGLNMGRAGGAGFDQHIHMHIVPRWNGDTNFMPVLTGTKIISESLDGMWKRIKEETK